MYTSLPKETKTEKINSLPSDLKEIAEGLIAKKFKSEEEVVERKAPDPFQGEYVGVWNTSPDFAQRSRFGDVRVTFDYATRERRACINIEPYSDPLRGIAAAMHKLDKKGLRNENRVIYIYPRTYDIFGVSCQLRLFGAEVKPCEDDRLERIEQIL